MVKNRVFKCSECKEAPCTIVLKEFINKDMDWLKCSIKKAKFVPTMILKNHDTEIELFDRFRVIPELKNVLPIIAKNLSINSLDSFVNKT